MVSRIIEVNNWQEIPRDRPVPSFEEMDQLLQEMKPLFAQSIKTPKEVYTKYHYPWYAKYIEQRGYDLSFSSGFGEWFFDSLIHVNSLLWKQEREGLERSQILRAGFMPTHKMNAYNLARVYGDCYHCLHPSPHYSYTLLISFYRDRDHTEEERDFYVTQMLDGQWQEIVRGFDLL